MFRRLLDPAVPMGTILNRVGPSLWQRETAALAVSSFLSIMAGLFTTTARAIEPGAWREPEILTNVVQLQTLPIQDFLRKCPLRLTGTVTMVDTNRSLLVLQDETGAVAINLDLTGRHLKPGQLVLVKAASCAPLLASFPDYPFKPAGRNIEDAFEGPSNWGNYHLTRMRGYLHPPVTGEYTFWIASDNSSELWLSSDGDPGKVRRIAFVRQWVEPHEWQREPAQRSETIFLQSDQNYYIEAFQEQLTQNDHLSVAWQGPGFSQSIVDGRHLTPWTERTGTDSFAQTNGIMREYWTNYSAGNLVGICGPKPFERALSLDGAEVTELGKGPMPQPREFILGEALSPDEEYLWVETEGEIAFAGLNGDTGILELAGGQSRIQVCLSNWKGTWPADAGKWLIRVRGVCEGTRNSAGLLVPELIWSSTTDGITFVESTTAKWESAEKATLKPPVSPSESPESGGFFITAGLVTFNGRFSGQDLLYVQVDGAAIQILQEERNWGAELRVGDWIHIGGDFKPGKPIPLLRPLTLRVSDPRPMPEPVGIAPDGKSDGRWGEFSGVVHSLNADGTLTLTGRSGPVSAWIEQCPSNTLAGYIDSVLRIRGVILPGAMDNPLLLVPSRAFVQMEEPPPAFPFEIPARRIVDLNGLTDAELVHRKKIGGVVTYKTLRSVFVQDSSGGVRVQTADAPRFDVGASVEVIGFPEVAARTMTLTEGLLRPAEPAPLPQPQIMDLESDTVAGYSGKLASAKATLLTQKERGIYHVLELQQGQRVFEALLAKNLDSAPVLAPGSRLAVTGVCETESSPAGESSFGANASTGPLRLLLRGRADIVLLRGPPWWTWRKAATLIGVLVTVLTVSVLWIHFLRRRLERQQAGRLAFSKQILESQERERRRIAANLHDSLGQNLLVIKNQARLAMQPAKGDSVLRKHLDEISSMALQAIEEIRQITHGLRPYQLDRLGLTQAIRAAISRVSGNSQILFASDVEEIDDVFDKESEIHLYRIVQESLNNVVKHSGATESTVVIKRRPGMILLSIRDNGQGFDANLLSSHDLETGFGISGIAERARILGGELTVESQPGEGTVVKIEIPVFLNSRK